MSGQSFGRVMVTGGAGFIGSHLVDALLPVSEQVTVFDDFSSGERANLEHLGGEARLDIVPGDIRNRDDLAAAVRDSDTVFHLAVQCVRLSLSDPALVHEVNATGSLYVALACHEASVQKLIYVSSSEVYGTAVRMPMDEVHPLRPTTVYGASKLAGEMYALAVNTTYGLPVTIVRPFNSYGPREHMQGVYGEVIPRFLANGLLSQQSVIYGTGEQTRDFTYVSDTVRGIILAAQSSQLNGEAVNIAAGTPVSINEVARLAAAETGTQELAPRMEPARPGDVMHHHASIDKARRLVGFEPSVGIREGVHLLAGWLRARPDLWRKSPAQFARPNW